MPRVDDRRVISGIIFVIKNGLRWRDAPRECGPHMIIYNRFVRRSRPGVFNRIFAELTAKGPMPERLMIDARTPSSPPSSSQPPSCTGSIHTES
jgi:transposase